jgi:hypothetical protein
MMEIGSERRQNSDLPKLEQAHVEVLQAFIACSDCCRKAVPTSPRHFENFWTILSTHMTAFLRKQVNPNDAEERHGQHRVKVHTLYFRNSFHKDDCVDLLLTLSTRLDPIAKRELGFLTSDLVKALLRVLEIVEAQIQQFLQRLRELLHSEDVSVVQSAANFFAEASPLAQKIWARFDTSKCDLPSFRAAAFQVSEMAQTWIYTLPEERLRREFSSEVIGALKALMLRPGELRDFNPEHIYLSNPVWSRPYLTTESGGLFAALPQLAVSFPFTILESVLEGSPSLRALYNDGRSALLEDNVFDVLRSAMPHAAVYRNVLWDDPASGKTYENDVVAILGNSIFLIEAKSGRLADAARRGGMLSIERNFKELFVEPAIQGARLQVHLDKHGSRASLRSKESKQPIDLHLERPKIVHTFSVCMEHLPGITSTRSYLLQLGLVNEGTPWAPVLSLGEFRMIERFLDSELSFWHYLSRRSTLESQLKFAGDEQDILSTYLTNGLFIDTQKLGGKMAFFVEADAVVRQKREPRQDRGSAFVHGVILSPMWREIVEELYDASSLPNRFDLIQVILNQNPATLKEMERICRAWRHGTKSSKENTIVSNYVIGTRQFNLIVHLAKNVPDSWHEFARQIATDQARSLIANDTVVFLQVRKSKTQTFDGFSFFRMVSTAND